jgi:fatty acid kinase fatty acid binding subunit
MSRIAIVTDSTASIPENLIDELEIHWVPYYIHKGQEVWRDLANISRKNFYEWLPTAQQLPQTACPGPGDYVELYGSLAEEGVQEIVSIHMTSKGSGAYQAATAAQSIVRATSPKLKVVVIDTLNVSMCHGWMVIEAARSALAGNSLIEVVGQVKQLIPVARMIQTADTLKYLYMGGRIGRARHLVGSLLNIKPLIGMEDGVIVPLGTARSRQGAYRMIVEMLEKAVGPQARFKIAYVHAAALDEAVKLREMVESRITAVESLIAELSPALGVHTGPGTTGVCYFPIPG